MSTIVYSVTARLYVGWTEGDPEGDRYMGQRIIVGREQGSDDEVAVLFDSTSGWVLGPVIAAGEDGTLAEDRAAGFLGWLEATFGDSDLRGMTDQEVERRWKAWLASNE